MWDRALNESMRQARISIGFNDAMDHDLQEINVAIGTLIPYAQHMYTIGWPVNDIRGLLRTYTLTLPDRDKQWKVITGFVKDMIADQEEKSSRTGKITRCVPPRITRCVTYEQHITLSSLLLPKMLGGNAWERYPSSSIIGWSLCTHMLVDEGELGLDIVDNTAQENSKLLNDVETITAKIQTSYTATVVSLREGPALQSGMRKNGIVVAIEGRHTLQLSFIEVVHCLKEASILRPFSITLAYKSDASAKKEEGTEEWSIREDNNKIKISHKK